MRSGHVVHVSLGSSGQAVGLALGIWFKTRGARPVRPAAGRVRIQKNLCFNVAGHADWADRPRGGRGF